MSKNIRIIKIYIVVEFRLNNGKIKSDSMKKYELTQEGREYLKKGLPEKQLLDILNKQPLKSMPFDEAKKSVDNFYIALQWALKNKWAKSFGKDLVLGAYPKEIPEQVALQKIDNDEDVDKESLEKLIQRKLVRKIVTSEADKLVGKEVTNLTPQLLKSGLWKQVEFKKYDVEVPVSKVYPGKLHPYRQVIEELREKFLGLGFIELPSPLVELSFWNFDALFMPQDHPARGLHDFFPTKVPVYGKILDKDLWGRVEETHKNGWITGSKGWGGNWNVKTAQRLLARSHDTGISARTVAQLKREDLPYKMFFIPHVFRPDVIDAKHLIEFDQCGGIVAGEGLHFRHLLGYLKEIALTVTGAEKVKFKSSYFPFTEPSVEGYAYHPKIGWFEFGGAGMFRPEVTLPLGIESPVLAWGLGLGRLAMIRLNVDDIRYLQTDNLKWLREKEMVI